MRKSSQLELSWAEVYAPASGFAESDLDGLRGRRDLVLELPHAWLLLRGFTEDARGSASTATSP